MIPEASGKRVAVVGRASGLGTSGQGAAIDACDLVVRVNWVLPLISAPEHIGSRTDVIYHAVSGKEVKAAAVAAGVPLVQVDRRFRKRLARIRRGYRPTSGIVAIFDALRCGAAAVHAFGFDFYATGYVEPGDTGAGRRVRKRPLKWKHDAPTDLKLTRRLLAEPRFHPDPVMLEILRA